MDVSGNDPLFGDVAEPTKDETQAPTTNDKLFDDVDLNEPTSKPVTSNFGPPPTAALEANGGPLETTATPVAAPVAAPAPEQPAQQVPVAAAREDSGPPPARPPVPTADSMSPRAEEKSAAPVLSNGSNGPAAAPSVPRSRPDGTIEVSITDFQKTDGRSAYVTYTVNTRTTMAHFGKRQMTTSRRYNDFYVLRNRLAKKNPTCLIPPIPAKGQWSDLDRFGSEFLSKRAKYLQRFVTAVVEHPKLVMDDNVVKFLEGTYWDSDTTKKESGFLEGLSSSMSKLGPTAHAKNPDQRFASYYADLQTFEASVHRMAKQAAKAAKASKDMADAFAELSPQFTNVAHADPQLQELLNAMATTTERYSKLVADCSHLIDTNLCDPAQFNADFSNACIELLKRRDQIESQYEQAQEAVYRKEAEIATVKGGGGMKTGLPSFLKRSKGDPQQQREEKLRRLDMELEFAKDHRELSEKHLKESNDTISAELHAFTAIKQENMKELLNDFGKLQMDFLEQSQKVWKTYETKSSMHSST
eukprot:Clim_evm22s66 gene=Clim_evmTU22s66